MMTRTVSADISADELASGTEYSDRYVYSNYFVPLLLTFEDDVTPIVPLFVKQQLLDYVRYGGLTRTASTRSWRSSSSPGSGAPTTRRKCVRGSTVPTPPRPPTAVTRPLHTTSPRGQTPVTASCVDGPRRRPRGRSRRSAKPLII